MELFSGLSDSLLAGTERTDKQTSGYNGVTTKSPVQYCFIKARTQIFIQKMLALLKPNEIKELTKKGAFLIREGF
jgi:hypothetical protein